MTVEQRHIERAKRYWVLVTGPMANFDGIEKDNRVVALAAEFAAVEAEAIAERDALAAQVAALHNALELIWDAMDKQGLEASDWLDAIVTAAINDARAAAEAFVERIRHAELERCLALVRCAASRR